MRDLEKHRDEAERVRTLRASVQPTRTGIQSSFLLVVCCHMALRIRMLFSGEYIEHAKSLVSFFMTSGKPVSYQL